MTRSAYGLTLDRGEDWQQHAACQVAPDAWFPVSPASPAASQALHICLTHCPVLRQCRAEADRTPPERRQGVILGGQYYYTHRGGEPHARAIVAADRCQLCPGGVPAEESPLDRRRRTWRTAAARRRAREVT